MPKISNSEDVYWALVENTDESWIFGLVSFAIIEEQRIEWMKHYEENNGNKPDALLIKQWYEQQPDGTLLRAKGSAENALGLYANEVHQEIIEIELIDIFKDAIVNEIRLGQRFLPLFGINILAGLFSTLIFAILITIGYFLITTDASLTKIGKEVIRQQTQERDNGTQNNQ